MLRPIRIQMFITFLFQKEEPFWEAAKSQIWVIPCECKYIKSRCRGVIYLSHCVTLLPWKAFGTALVKCAIQNNLTSLFAFPSRHKGVTFFSSDTFFQVYYIKSFVFAWFSLIANKIQNISVCQIAEQICNVTRDGLWFRFALNEDV